MSMIPNLEVAETHYYIGEVIRDGEVIQRSGKSGNLIVDAGWAIVRASSSMMLFMSPCVGTGSTPPAVTDTALAAFLYSTSNADTQSLLDAVTHTTGGDAGGTVPRYSNVEQAFTWALGAVVGNVTEVGLYVNTDRSQAAPLGDLYSRALFVDGGGSPVTLVVTASDYLRITIYRERKTQQTNITGSFDYSLEGVVTSVSYEAQPASRQLSNFGNVTGWHTVYNSIVSVPDSASPLLTVGHQCIQWGESNNGNFFSSPSPPAAFPTIWTTATFSATGSSTFDGAEPSVVSVVGDTITVEGNYGPSTGNTTTIQAFYLACGYAQWSIKFGSTLQKTNLQSIVFNFSVTFSRNVP